MSIHRILIQNKNKERLAELRTSAKIKTADSLPVNISGRTCEIGAHAGSSYLEQAVEHITAGVPYVSRINGVAPAGDGVFFILGSGCMSIDNTNRTKFIDLCAACSSCAADIELKRQLEMYGIWLNALKDAQLYSTATVDARTKYMEARRMVIPENCELSEDPSADNGTAAGLRLFQQYVTTVWMWNYAVSQNNSSTAMEIAPDDNAGFVVQTKRALPSCNGMARLTCTINISQMSGQSDLSVYIPAPELLFKPENFGADVSNTPTAIAAATATSKTITVAFPNAARAGTYMVTAKILPFIYTEMRDSKGNLVDIRNLPAFTSEPDASQEDGGQIFNGDIGTVIKVLVYPTEAQYTEAKTYPSVSSETRNRWNVEVKWTWVQTDKAVEDKIYTEHYIYETGGVRTVKDGLLVKDVLPNL